jgi:hypothetical protein
VIFDAARPIILNAIRDVVTSIWWTDRWSSPLDSQRIDARRKLFAELGESSLVWAPARGGASGCGMWFGVLVVFRAWRISPWVQPVPQPWNGLRFMCAYEANGGSGRDRARSHPSWLNLVAVNGGE